MSIWLFYRSYIIKNINIGPVLQRKFLYIHTGEAVSSGNQFHYSRYMLFYNLNMFNCFNCFNVLNV